MRPMSRWAVVVPVPGLSRLELTLVSRADVGVHGLQDHALVTSRPAGRHIRVDLLPNGHPNSKALVPKDGGWHPWVDDDHRRGGASKIAPMSATMRSVNNLRFSALPWRCTTGLLLHGAI